MNISAWISGISILSSLLAIARPHGIGILCPGNRISALDLAAYRAPNETSVLVAVTFPGCFQTDNINEVVERLNHRGISLVEGGDFFSGNGLVRGKGLQDAGRQWGINLFIKLQENQADLIAVSEEPVAAE
jgi:hypothetical protein